MNAFSNLNQLKQGLVLAAAAKKLAAEQAAASEAKALKEARLFVDAVGPVQAIKQAAKSAKKKS